MAGGDTDIQPDALQGFCSMNEEDPAPRNLDAELLSVLTQAVEPHPLPSSRETSNMVRMSGSRLPKRRGTDLQTVSR
jgi:hypothetical protein